MLDNYASVTSGKKQRVDVDVSNTSTTHASDVNVSGLSTTPASDAAGDSMATRRTRRHAPSLPSLLEIPPMEIPPTQADQDDQLVVMSGSGDEMIAVSSSHEMMVSAVERHR